MEKTTFKDVAHLYLGCKIKTAEGVGTFEALYTGGDEPIISFDLIRAHLKFNQVRPILRPLSSISENEISNYLDIEGSATAITNLDREIQSRAYSPKSLVYLLSRRFDLFGLIDSGEAINANSLKENPYQ